MEASMLTYSKRGSLPKLSTSKELSRRDSLSSSRTKDSGYSSDLDTLFSPLDYADSEQHALLSRIPSLPGTLVRRNMKPIDELGVSVDASNNARLRITSCPVPDGSLRTKKQWEPIPRSQDLEADPVTQDDDIEMWMRDNLPAHKRPEKRVSSITSLSSATSLELYTDTDMSDEEQGLDGNLPRPRLPNSSTKTINLIMREVESTMRHAAIQTHGTDTPATSSNDGCGSQHRQGNRKASQSTGKRKARSDEDLQPNNDKDNIANKRRRGSLAVLEGSEIGARFACPFYKHEPHRFRDRRTCPGPGWPTVHRMKEHLYRAHAQSIHCPRCYATFDTDSDLSSHLRSAQCQVSAEQPLEGIDRETLKVLRKRSPVSRPEDVKWRVVYQLLFPEVAVEDIPSPYYDIDAPNEDSRRFRRELLRRIQSELTSTAGEISGPVQQQLLQQVAAIVRRCEENLLNYFDATSLVVPPLSDRRASDTPTWSTFSGQHTPHDAQTSLEYSESSTQSQYPVRNTMSFDSLSLPDESAQPHLASEQQGAFAYALWDQQQLLDPNTNWVEIGDMIPPTEESCGNELFTHFFGVPWT